jgi:putative zinc finger/helix-turn-helix YgiT family protein
MDKKLERNKCELCGGAMVTRKATVERPYRYTLSGLDNVRLVGIDVHECPKCDIKVPVIPKIAALNKAIAQDLMMKKELLSGKEIRFLRKHAEIAAKEFAAMIGVTPAHLSRFENGKTENLSPGIDKLARAVIAAKTNGENWRKIALALTAEHFGEQLSLFSPKKDHWEKLAA